MDARNPNALTITLPSDCAIALTRRFDAPRALVWDAWTKPEHVRRWYGCSIMTLVTCEIDLRVGGGYRFVMRGPDGSDWPVSGVYREIVRPQRLIYTERFEHDPGKEAVVTLTLEEARGKTTLHSVALYASRQHRDAVLKMGMEDGATESMNRLDALLGAMV